MKLLHRDSVTLRARLDVSLVGAVTQKQVFSPGGEIEQQLLREEEEEGERGGIESGETENPRAPVTNVKCRHQSNYRFLSGGNEGTTTTTTSTRVEKKGERIDEEGVSSTGGSVGGRSNFKCKVLFESGFPLFCRGLRFKNCVGKYFLQWIIGNYRVVGKILPR